jgi:hypothetical protein
MTPYLKLAVSGLLVAAGAAGAYAVLARDPIPETLTCLAQSMCTDGTSCVDLSPPEDLLLTGFDETGATSTLAPLGGAPVEQTVFGPPQIGSAGGLTFKSTSNLGHDIAFFYGHEIRRFKYTRRQNDIITEIVGGCVTY